MRKIWLLLMFLVNLTPNILNGTFTLTSMNRMFAQVGINEFVCEEEGEEPFASSIPCDELPCIAVCPDCDAQNICIDEHICPEEECETCGESYPVGSYHDCGSKHPCSLCGTEFYPLIGHTCSGTTDNGGTEDNGGTGDNGNNGDNTPPDISIVLPEIPVSPPITSTLPTYSAISTRFLEVAKLSVADFYKKIGGNALALYLANPTGYGNTCAIRLSYALNMSSFPIKEVDNKTIWGLTEGDKYFYYYRIADLVDYLNDYYTEGVIHYTSSSSDTIYIPQSLVGKTGIICQMGHEDPNSMATGHIDIWDGNNFLNKGIGNYNYLIFWELK